MDIEAINLDELFDPAVANLQLPDPGLAAYYSDMSKRIYFLEGEIGDDSLEFVKIIMRANLKDAAIEPSKRTPICIFIDSVGGDVQVMWSIVNAIGISKTPVHTIVYSTALSAAAHILASGHKRFAFPGSTILVHSGSCQFTGDVEKVESAKRYYDSLAREANDKLLEQTKIAPKDLKKKGASDWYMSAEDAVKNGVVDKIVEDMTEVFA